MTNNLENPRDFFLILVIILVLMTEWAIAGDGIYQRMSLGEGISIEVPSHWFVHSDADKNNFAAAAEASSRMAGIHNDNIEKKSRLLALSALPTPTGATIRVNVIRPLTFSGSELRAATAQDLKDMKDDFSAEMVKGMSEMGATLFSMETPSVGLFNGRAAILFEYRRSDLNGPSPWTVKQYRIPAGDKLIEFTMSYRESDAFVWRPILEYSKQSLRF